MKPLTPPLSCLIRPRLCELEPKDPERCSRLYLLQYLPIFSPSNPPLLPSLFPGEGSPPHVSLFLLGLALLRLLGVERKGKLLAEVRWQGGQLVARDEESRHVEEVLEHPVLGRCLRTQNRQTYTTPISTRCYAPDIRSVAGERAAHPW